MALVGFESWLLTLLETTLPVVPAGNWVNCLESPLRNNVRPYNIYQIMYLYIHWLLDRLVTTIADDTLLLLHAQPSYIIRLSLVLFTEHLFI